MTCAIDMSVASVDWCLNENAIVCCHVTSAEFDSHVLVTTDCIVACMCLHVLATTDCLVAYLCLRVLVTTDRLAVLSAHSAQVQGWIVNLLRRA